MFPLRVASNRRATPTSRALRLAVGDHPFTYRAGQAAWLRVDPERERTPYSIASSPEETSRRGWIEFLVKTDQSNRFGAHVDTLPRGSTVLVHGPTGAFVFPETPAERRFLFIAGGTGIAPLRSMLRHAIDASVPGRKTLLYSARTADEFAYLPELRALARQGSIDLTLTLTGIAERWRHSRGRAGTELLAPLVDDETLCFLCGPPAMVDAVRSFLTAQSVAPANFYYEKFAGTGLVVEVSIHRGQAVVGLEGEDVVRKRLQHVPEVVQPLRRRLVVRTPVEVQSEGELERERTGGGDDFVL